MLRGVAVSLVGGVCLLFACQMPVAADAAACRRVLPEGGFERQLIVPDGSVSLWTRLGASGERGLYLAGSRFDGDILVWRHWLRRLYAEPGGEAAVTGETAVEGPGGRAGLRALLAADADGDGLEDAVIVWGSERRCTPIAVDLHLRLDEGGVGPAQRLSLGEGLVRDAPRLADFDGDGRPEVALIAPACSGCPQDLHVVELDPAEGPSIGSTVPGPHLAPSGVLALDVDRDGIDDLLLLSDKSVTTRLGAEEEPLAARIDRTLPFKAVDFGKRDGKLIAVEGHLEWVGWWPSYHYDAVHEFGKDLEPLWSQPLPDEAGKLRPSIDVDGDDHQELQHGFRFDSWWFGTSIVGSRLLWGAAAGPLAEGPTLGTQRHLIAMMGSGDRASRVLVTSDFAVVPLADPGVVHDGAIASLFAEAPFWDQPYAWIVAGDLNEDGLDDVVGQTFFAHRAAVGLAVGDGTFEFEPFGVSPRELQYPRIVDHDGDGHLDLSTRRRALGVAWGRGDGTFEWPPEGVPYERVSREFWDLDRDGDDDAVEWWFTPYYDSATLHTVLFDGRDYRRSEPLWEAGEGWRRRLLGADIDGDGIKDLVVTKILTGEPSADRSTDRLYWLRSKGDGRFEPATPLVHEELPETLGLKLVGADFDLDGRDDLFLHTDSSYPAQGEYISLRNAGGGRLVTVWRRAAAAVSRYPVDQLADVNGDGRPDLVAGRKDPWAYPSYASMIWWGDGLGGFEPSNDNGWGVSPGAVGRFTSGGGLDMARIRQFNHRLANLELFVGRGRIKDRDEIPPEVEITLIPVVDTSVVPARFDGSWRIATVPIDDCDDAPRVRQRVVELLGLPPDTLVSYHRAVEAVVEIYEIPAERAVREVVLRGPDEREMYGLLETGREAGGFAFEHWGAPVRLSSSPAYGVGSYSGPSAARRVQRFEFARNPEGRLRLTAASQTHPMHPLMIAAHAEDAAGRLGITRTSLPRARAQAIDNLCEQAPDAALEPPVICPGPEDP